MMNLSRILSHLYAGFLGVASIDLVNNLVFDWNLLRSEGWKTPVKAVTRIAYFICRLLPIVTLSMALMFTTHAVGKNTDCNRFVSINQSLLVPLLNSASLIFVIRTISLYACKRSIMYTVGGLWLIVLASCEQAQARRDSPQ